MLHVGTIINTVMDWTFELVQVCLRLLLQARVVSFILLQI